MDQDSFRRLLNAGGSQQPQRSRGSLLAPGGTTAPKRKTVDASEPAFKPRKVNKTQGKYRDRAAERRVGEGNDYAEVESVLEDLQKRQAVSDEQRKYLGGDGDHSILVKGLDVALLEQNKAKAALSTVDDDSLEQAFMGGASSSQPTVPKKRTREDIIRELKEKRGIKSDTAAEPTADTLEAAKKQGKFKPIGFKPIGSAEKKAKKPEESRRTKKKRKIEPTEEKKTTPPLPETPASAAVPVASSSKPSLPEEDPPEDDDFDIFAGAEEYEADFGDDDDEDSRIPDKDTGMDAVDPPRKWFEEEEPEPESLPSAPKLPLPASVNKPPPRPIEEEGEEDDELEHPTRLVPLEGSTVPSIKELLAMDEAANSSNKRKKRKDRKKGGKDSEDADAPAKPKMSAEDKAERDYKRLKNYTDKQGV